MSNVIHTTRHTWTGIDRAHREWLLDFQAVAGGDGCTRSAYVYQGTAREQAAHRAREFEVLLREGLIRAGEGERFVLAVELDEAREQARDLARWQAEDYEERVTRWMRVFSLASEVEEFIGRQFTADEVWRAYADAVWYERLLTRSRLAGGRLTHAEWFWQPFREYMRSRRDLVWDEEAGRLFDPDLEPRTVVPIR